MLNISPEKVCYIIIKAREFDVKDEPVEPGPDANPADSGEREISSDCQDDPTYEELRTALEVLNNDEMVDILALVWLGRGDYTKDEWADALAQAAQTRNERAVPYLIGIPLLGDYLEEGLSQLGYACEDYEVDRL